MRSPWQACCSYYILSYTQFDSEMPRKKKTQALQRSLQLIEQERVNVAIRPKQRIAQLFADELNEADVANTVDFNDKPKDKV